MSNQPAMVQCDHCKRYVNKPFYSSRALNLDVCQTCASYGITLNDVTQSAQAPATTTGCSWSGSGYGSNTSAKGYTVPASQYKDVSGLYPAPRPQQTAPSRMSAVMRAPYSGDSTGSGYGSSRPAGEFASRDTQSRAYYDTAYGPVGPKEIRHGAIPKEQRTQEQWNELNQDQADITESMRQASWNAGVF